MTTSDNNTVVKQIQRMTFSLVARHCQLSSFFRARGRNLHSLHIDSTKSDAHQRRQRVPDAGHGADISMSTGLLDYFSRITLLVPSEGWDYRMTATPPLSAAGPLAGHNVSLDCVQDGRSWQWGRMRRATTFSNFMVDFIKLLLHNLDSKLYMTSVRTRL